MDIVIGNRQAGKTHEAVKIWKDNGYDGLLVVISATERHRIIGTYDIPPEYRYRIVLAMDFPHIRERSSVLRKLYIDNADMIFHDLYWGTPEVITTSGQATILHGGR